MQRRKCKFMFYDPIKKENCAAGWVDGKGYFFQFGTNGKHSVAIVEHEDGRVLTVEPDHVVFIKEENDPESGWFQALFNHMSEYHGLILTQTEMQDIADVIHKSRGIPGWVIDQIGERYEKIKDVLNVSASVQSLRDIVPGSQIQEAIVNLQQMRDLGCSWSMLENVKEVSGGQG